VLPEQRIAGSRGPALAGFTALFYNRGMLEFCITFVVFSLVMLLLRWLILGKDDDGQGPWTPWG
jgi:hypothetical protein